MSRPAVHAGAAHVLPHRQRDGTARALDLVRDLHPARRRADDHHAALGEGVRIAVLLRRQRGDRRRDRLGAGRHVGHVEGSGRQHDGRALPFALVGGDAVAAVATTHRRHRRTGLDRGGDVLGVAGDEVDDLWHRHEPVGVVTLIGVAGEPALPVGREQAQRIPPLRPPRVGDLAALDHHVVDGALGKAAAHRQPAMAGPDDDRCRVHGRCQRRVEGGLDRLRPGRRSGW